MDLQKLFTDAIRQHAQGNFAEAKKKYLKVLEELPENVSVLGNLGIVCRDLKQLDEAYAYCNKAITHAPQDPDQHINLGAICEAMADLGKAKRCYEGALKILPTHPKALNNLGKLYHLQGNPAEALVYLKKALQVEPSYPMALNNIGVILSEKGEVRSAVSYLEKSYSMDPYNHETLYNLAGLYNCLGEPVEAQKMLESLLEFDPDHASAQHMLAAVSGKTTDTAPSAYIEETFDRYANRFDIHLQESLGYDTPSTLAAMLAELEPARRFQICLDLGCGTGLSGDAFKDCTESLIGVDLSSQMLGKAEEKGIYTQLHCQEIYDFLRSNKDEYDLFLAADVFIYLGRLDVFFREITNCMKKDAMIACSIERHDGIEDFVLRSSGRYAHKPAYLEDMAKKWGFSILRHKDHGIRKENDEWIQGDLYILRKSS